MRLIDADLFDMALEDAQAKCKKSGGNFRYGVLSNVRAKLLKQPTVDAVPIKAISAWLAAYASPPNYALDEVCEDIDPASIVYTAYVRARAWEYHWKNLMECGLIREGLDAEAEK